jgi:hypothetical protein
MAEDGKKDIHRQLRDAQEQREKLMEALKESESIIASIEARLNEVTQSQDARLRADDRVDNKLLDDIQRKKIKPFIDSGEHEKLEVTQSGSISDKGENGDNGKKKPDNSKQPPPRTVQSEGWYEITIDEDGNKKERLRKNP